ncbi:MAG: hypothetical protein WBA45_16040 [Microthrixaceae bacterium]
MNIEVSNTATNQMLFGSVSVGDKLPELSVDVTPTTVVLGALASRDWRPMHHDYKFATERNGVADIFLNTPNQAAWFERFITDWTGPKGRLGRMKFRMKTSVFPGDLMVLTGTVTAVETDDAGCGWATIAVAMNVGDTVASTCDVRVAVPVDDNDNPWIRSGERWTP